MKTSLKTLFGASFGKLDSKDIVLTINGLGFKDGDSYNVLDKDSKTITTVPADFVLGQFPIYAIPCTDKDLKVGDLVMHRDYLKFYLGTDDDGNHKVIQFKTQEVQTLVPTKTMFGYSVFSKVISLFDGLGTGAPVGPNGFNLQSLALMSVLGDGDGLGGLFGDDDGDGGIGQLMMIQALGSGGLGNLFGGAAPADVAAAPQGNMFQTIMTMKMLKGLL